jgi:hypothetical protein
MMNIDPVKYTLTCWQGKTFEKIFYLKDAQDNIILLNGYTARMHVRPSIDSDTITLDLNTENGRIEINGDDGSVTLYVADEDTEDIAAGTYKYDLEIVSAGGRVYCPIYGSFKVKGEVTRSA